MEFQKYGRKTKKTATTFLDVDSGSVDNKGNKYHPSGAGGTRSPPATPHRLQNPKWPPGGPKMADGVWKGVQPKVIGHFKQLSLNKFFDTSTPSMRKGCDGEEWNGKWRKKIMVKITVH